MLKTHDMLGLEYGSQETGFAWQQHIILCMIRALCVQVIMEMVLCEIHYDEKGLCVRHYDGNGLCERLYDWKGLCLRQYEESISV